MTDRLTELIYHCLAMGYWKELMTDRLTELIYHCLAMGYGKN